MHADAQSFGFAGTWLHAFVCEHAAYVSEHGAFACSIVSPTLNVAPDSLGTPVNFYKLVFQAQICATNCMRKQVSYQILTTVKMSRIIIGTVASIQ